MTYKDESQFLEKKHRGEEEMDVEPQAGGLPKFQVKKDATSGEKKMGVGTQTQPRNIFL